MKRKNKQAHNYIVLAIIYILVIVLVLYLASWYNTYKKYEQGIPVLRDIVSEINPNELEHYITENPTAVLYFCKVSDKKCREFEESIKSPLEKNTYGEITYVNLEDTTDTNLYLDNLLNKFNGKDFTIERVPCLIKFTDGKITSVEDGLNGAVLTRDEALNFFDINAKMGQ